MQTQTHPIPKNLLGLTQPNLPIHLCPGDLTWHSSRRSPDGRRVLLTPVLNRPDHPFIHEVQLMAAVWVDCDARGVPLEPPSHPKWLVP